jgi:hypothetical protein
MQFPVMILQVISFSSSNPDMLTLGLTCPMVMLSRLTCQAGLIKTVEVQVERGRLKLNMEHGTCPGAVSTAGHWGNEGAESREAPHGTCPGAVSTAGHWGNEGAESREAPHGTWNMPWGSQHCWTLGE